jgi:hypothetical protein
MQPTRAKAGISKLAVPVALIVILAVAGAYVFLTRTPATTQSSSGTSPSVPVQSAVNQLVQDLKGRNVDGLATFYTPSSVTVWSGRLVGLQGKYTSTGNIRLLYATTIGKTTTVDANVSNYVEHVFSPTNVNATFMLALVANSSVAGVVKATIDVTQEWNWGNSGWQISKENWAYNYYDSSFIDAGIPSATTFPQWGVMQMGGNPNLVSEKSFEWHAGPYLAAGIYAFLAGIAVVLALRLTSRGSGSRPDEKRRAAGT